MPGYTMDDLTIRRGERDINGEITAHTHTVIFSRPLSNEEQQLFMHMIQGFYYTVRFSQQFGDGLLAEPMIEFRRPDEARYTLRQYGVSEPWKDLLFAMLANFSYEIVGIREHDGSHVFDPARRPTTALSQAEVVRLQPVLTVHEPRPGYAAEPPEPSGTAPPRRPAEDVSLDVTSVSMRQKRGEGKKMKVKSFIVTIEQDEDGWYVVECPAIPGCVSQGRTQQEALENIKEAIELCLEVRQEMGLPLTIETHEVRVPVYA